MMLKCLCDTTPVKRVEWGSTHAVFKSSLPRSFDSISRVCLIANDWNAIDRNIGALYDRGIVILFEPPVLEVHQELARSEWFDDEEVFDFVGRNLYLVAEPSFRFYQTAKDHKQAGLDWRDLVLRTIEGAADEKLILVAPARRSAVRCHARTRVGAGAGLPQPRWWHKGDVLPTQGRPFCANGATLISTRSPQSSSNRPRPTSITWPCSIVEINLNSFAMAPTTGIW